MAMLIKVTITVLTLLCGLVGQALAEMGAPLDLRGDHPFTLMDDPAFADPEYDDRDWRRLPIPSDWLEHGAPASAEIGWRRVRFDTPPEGAFRKPVFVYHPKMTDEVYLNGVKIGGEGRIGAQDAYWRVRVPPGRIRVYPIPTELLRDGEPNVLAIRMQHLRVAEVGGIGDGLFGIYEYGDVIETIAKRRAWNWLLDGLYIGVGLVLVCLAAPVLIFGVRTRLTISFTALAAMYLISSIRWSHAASEGLAISFFWNEVIDRMDAMVVVVLIEVVAALLAFRVGLFGRLVQGAVVISLIPPFFMSTMVGRFWFDYGLFGMIPAFAAAAIWILAASARAIRQGKTRGYVILLVVPFTILAPAIVTLSNPASPFLLFEGDRLTASVTTLFILTLAIMASLEVIRIERERAEANARALKAQAEERARIARDVHDGVGQWLSSLKLRLQMAFGALENVDRPMRNKFSDIIDNVDGLIDDTRRIAHHLSPAYIQEFGFIEALHTYAQEVGEDYGTRVDLQIPEALDLPLDYQEHLFRITQEAIRNAIEHGAASVIGVTLLDKPERKELVISDNGTGLVGKTNPTFSLGLRSMKDRAKMIEGDMAFEASPGGGLLIRIVFDSQGKMRRA